VIERDVPAEALGMALWVESEGITLAQVCQQPTKKQLRAFESSWQ